MISPTLKRGDQLGLALLSLLLFWAARATADVDDALITYRYAANLGAGRGFVYNTGESIWGTSAPLYALVLGLASALGFEPAAASHVLGLVSGVAVVLLTMLLAVRLSGSRTTGWIAGLWCAGCGPLAVWAVSGMETLPYTALIVGTFTAARWGRADLAAVLAGLAFVMRVDGAILLPALLLYLLLAEEGRLPVRAAAIWLLVAAPWYLFALWQFSSVLPHSFAAKRTHVKLETPDWFLRYFWNAWRPALAAAAAGCLRALRMPREPDGALVLASVSWLFLYGAAYSMAGLDFYEWYCVPALPVLGLLAALGVDAVARLVPGPPRGAAVLRAGAGALLVIFAVWPRANYVRSHRAYLDSVEATRKHIGEWLSRATPDGAVISTGAIGQIGYYSRRRIDDVARLVSDPPDDPPDYHVGHDVPGDPRGSFGGDPAFVRDHVQLAVFVPPAPHDALVYRVFHRLARPRRDPPLGPATTSTAVPGSAAFGAEVDFTTLAARALLANGWSEPEPGFGTWALGKSSTLQLATPAVTARLTVELSPFAPPGSRAQVVTLERGGVPMGSVALEAGWQEWVAVLPAGNAAAPSRELIFRFDHAISPREAGVSEDPRPLAAALRRLLVEPLVALRYPTSSRAGAQSTSAQAESRGHEAWR